MSVIKSRSASFSVFLKLPLTFNNVLIFRGAYVCDLLLFLQQRAFVNFIKSEKVSDFYSLHDFVF